MCGASGLFSYNIYIRSTAYMSRILAIFCTKENTQTHTYTIRGVHMCDPIRDTQTTLKHISRDFLIHRLPILASCK